ncbi:MAG: hypothetical protein K5945_05545, partial [Bacteroidaceae bacterium]|nr:hypothetical protein [Bacteroidaceae bacterium]
GTAPAQRQDTIISAEGTTEKQKNRQDLYQNGTLQYQKMAFPVSETPLCCIKNGTLSVKNAPLAVSKMAVPVSNATLRYQKMIFLAAGRQLCRSKQEPLRQQAGAFTAASRKLCGSKQETLRQHTFLQVEASMTFLSLIRSRCI